MGKSRNTARRGRAAAEAVVEDVDGGRAELVPDRDRPRAWTLLIDGAPQSHVDLDDPAYLSFEYQRRIGHVIDLAAPPGKPVRAVHLGGGALTLARYVAATRTRSTQQVVERDAALVQLVRRELPLDPGARIRVRSTDARAGLAKVPDGWADLVVADVFGGARTPAHLTSTEFLDEVRRALAPGGVYAANLADGPPLAHLRGQIATAAARFGALALVADPAVLRQTLRQRDPGRRRPPAARRRTHPPRRLRPAPRARGTRPRAHRLHRRRPARDGRGGRGLARAAGLRLQVSPYRGPYRSGPVQ
ncbi:hypothetical protein SMCF_7575 [Streptomyces coelicoflavus ZG0656]|nr:hypothetical protein SMCF_7575 [Streptomyces coelicoflavus ZG0656]